MVNMFMLVGRVELITDDYVQMLVTDKNQKELHMRVYVVGTDTFKLNVRSNLEIGGVVGVKGQFGSIESNKELKLIGEKFTFLGKAGSISATEGDELLDE